QPPIAIHDILVGEVWLCSGQSNMAMTVNRAKDFEKEQAAANLPHVRMFRESSGPAETPQEKCSGTWAVCSPETVGAFSATAYFFGRKLHQELNVPVGLINSSVGGTPIEAWTSRDVMADKPEFKPLFERWEKMQAAWDPQKAHAQYEKQLAVWKEAARKAKAAGKPVSRPPRKPEEPRLSTHRPANLFNGKIAPLVPLAIRGAIWYQGESNASTPEAARLYATQLPLMIKDWRARWGYDFPFAWVQLPNFKKPSDNPGALSAWAVMRESMLKSLSVPNTGMAITIDIGEADDIHPKNKQDVGQRLAMWALGKGYQKKIATSGPLPVRHETCGGEMTITFQHTDGGLVVKIGEALTTPRADSPTVWPEGLGGFGQVRGFAIAGADRKWHWAKAKIVGDTVVVAAPEVKQPVAVRYAWGDNPDCNLYKRAGLPASPFRT
ncbi:MAG: sialate O-acetylesterase, partial [Verrucomicrobiae bacterium]|nr:sialate O-acetylesterase [Verrucomicrobiae bacterium]